MYDKRSMRITLLLLMSFCTSVTFADLLAYYPFDEGAGTEAADGSGNGNHGTLSDSIEWIEGWQDTAVHLDTAGERIVLNELDPSAANDAMTMMAWALWEGNGHSIPHQGIIGKRLGWEPKTNIRWFWEVDPTAKLAFRNGDGAVEVPGALAPYENEWTHLALTWNDGAVVQYVNAEEVGTGTMTLRDTAGATIMTIGCTATDNSETFVGGLDEVKLFDTALTADEIALAMLGQAATRASGSLPSAGATDVSPVPQLAWTAGDFAASHDVYFGQDFDDVNEATTADTVYMGRQTATSFDPGKLAIDTTYYWRIDEVNAPPSTAIFKGTVWNFTTESVADVIGNVSATASSYEDETMRPEDTVNGSGLNAEGQHSIDMTHMWLNSETEPSGAWIRYAFDQAYKLHRVHVWNHNSQAEKALGFGIKDALIEYSQDDETWTELKTVELPQGTARGDYTGVDVTLDGVIAQYIRITAQSNWSALPTITQTGLSEVRFYSIPVQSRKPNPANFATSDGLDVTLQWRPGREADQHEVVVSTDRPAVIDNSAVMATTGDAFYDLGTLDMGTQYFWRVNEINDVETPSVFEGPLWRFVTPEHIMADDMEMYNDKDGYCIWEYWVDGYDDDDNGSIVGHDNDPERSIVYEGRQSLPMTYDTKTAAISEATQTFDPVLDWTKGGPETLSLHCMGRLPDYEEDGAGNITIAASGADIWGVEDDFRFVYRRLTGDGSIQVRVNSLVNTNEWAKAGVMIRESLSPASRNATVAVSVSNGVRFQARSETFVNSVNDDAALDDVQQTLSAPVWVKIERVGGQFNGYYATDEAGTNWVAMGRNPQSISMISDVYIGLAVTSHNVNLTTAATFSDLSSTGNVSGASTAVAIGGDHPSNDAAPLYLVVTDSAGNDKVFTDPAQTSVKPGWEPAWTIPMADLAGLNLNSIESITIGVGDPDGTQASGAEGMIYVDNIRVVRPYATTDLVAEYPFEGDAMDVSGNGRNGTIVGDPELIDGAIGQALEFEGTGSQYVDLGTWDPAGPAKELSVSLFAKWNGLSSRYQGLIGKRDSWNVADMMWDLVLNKSDGVLRFGRAGSTVGTSNAVLPEGEWQHVGVTVSGSHVDIYVGGEIVGSGDNFSFGTDTKANMQIAADQPNGGDPFNGALDEVKIYGRALSEAEMKALAGVE